MKTEKEVSLSGIKTLINSQGVAEARQRFASAIGSKVKITGSVLKVIKREGLTKLLIQADLFKVFADFEKGFPETFKKNQSVSLSGKLKSFGSESICLEKVTV